MASLRRSVDGLGKGGVEVQGCKCLGLCKRGPAVHVAMASGDSATYVGVDSPGSVSQIAVTVLHQ